MASASRKPTTTPTAKPAAARRSEYQTADTTDDSTVPLAPATSCLPKAPKISDRCGIDVSSLRGRISVSPTRTPSSGITSL